MSAAMKTGNTSLKPLAGSPALEIIDLRKTFRTRRGEVHAVRDVSFTLEAGGSLAVVGESGSGKTTTARIIMGLEAQTSGIAKVFGAERSARPTAAERRTFGGIAQMVFQDPYSSLDPRMTVSESIRSVLRLHGDSDRRTREQRVRELFDLVGLSGRLLEARPKDMSGGQRQRVAIARALAPEPRLVVLDEAVAALDVSVQAQVLNLLADIREATGVAYLFISHDLAVVRQITETAVVMYRGEIVEQGSTAEILDHPSHPYTRHLRASIPGPEWRGRDRYSLPFDARA